MEFDPIDIPFLLHGHHVPGFWQYLLPQSVLDLKLPPEKRATCMDCPKAKYDGFLPDYRCCTYIPRVPNFLLGLALKHPTPKKILVRLNKSGQLTPEGMHISPQQWAEYLADNAAERFGKSDVVRCPFLNRSNGYCEMYAYRNSVCSTFFCMHSHGPKGDRLWNALQTLVQQAEMALSQWALEQVGFDVKQFIKRMNQLSAKVEKVANHHQPRTWTTAARKVMWGDRFGYELETFEACAEKIREHRHDLWHLANIQPILEPAAFDRAARRVVPKAYREEIDPSDYDEGENFLPRELVRSLLSSHKKLWEVPGTNGSGSLPLYLSPRALVEKNELNDRESKDFSHMPYVVSFYGKTRNAGPEDLEWREFIPAGTAHGLKLFAKSRQTSASTLKRLEEMAGEKATEFLAEWLGKKVLRVAQPRPR